jgi:hypothetical protein
MANELPNFPAEEVSAETVADACAELVQTTTSLLVDLGYITGATTMHAGRKVAVEDAEAAIKRVAELAQVLRKVTRESVTRIRLARSTSE